MAGEPTTISSQIGRLNMEGNEKKRHHYVPICYLRPFCNDREMLFVFPQDGDAEPFEIKPENIAFEKYYYSQPLPDGGRDNNAIEDTFSKIEAEWTPLLNRWRSADTTPDKLLSVFEFIMLMRMRVPAMRDAVEAMLAEEVKSTTRVMHKFGQLPPLPPEHPDLLDQIQVTIDPHRSIIAMQSLAKGMGILLDRLGLEIVLNHTGIPLITSDNPVSYFDPDEREENLKPYTVASGSQVELLLPVAPDLILRGHSKIRASFGAIGLRFRKTTNRREIRRYNRITARFAYRFAFAQDMQSNSVIRAHSARSPILNVEVIPTAAGELIYHSNVFGMRPPKPKWTGAGKIDT